MFRYLWATIFRSPLIPAHGTCGYASVNCWLRCVAASPMFCKHFSIARWRMKSPWCVASVQESDLREHFVQLFARDPHVQDHRTDIVKVALPRHPPVRDVDGLEVVPVRP